MKSDLSTWPHKELSHHFFSPLKGAGCFLVTKAIATCGEIGKRKQTKGGKRHLTAHNILQTPSTLSNKTQTTGLHAYQ